MIRILKYPLRTEATTIITANVIRWLTVGFQGQQLVAWAEVSVPDDGSPAVRTRVLRVVATVTGAEAPESGQGFRTEYIGTATLLDAEPGLPFYVAHVYQLNP